MDDKILSHDLYQVDPNSYTLSEDLKTFSEKCAEREIDTIYFKNKRFFARPQVAMRIDSNSREMICKLIAMQITKKDKTFLFSVSPDGSHIYLSISDEKIGQSQQFIEELVADMDSAGEAVIDERIMKNVEALVKFAENGDFIPSNTKNGDHYGYFYEIDSNSKIVTFHNPRLYDDNLRNPKGKIKKTITIPFDRLCEEYEIKALHYGAPKDTSVMTDEEYEKAVEVWSEGNPELKKTLMLARKLNIQTKGCCAGHNFKNNSPQITFLINNEESKEIISKLLALKMQHKGDIIGAIFLNTNQEVAASLFTSKYGYNEEFFKEMNEEIESFIQGKENPNTKVIDTILGWLKNNYDDENQIEFFSEKQLFSKDDTYFPTYPISTLEEMVDESHSIDEFDGKMRELFKSRIISIQELKQTTKNILKKGLSFSSFKNFLGGLLKKIGLISKDEHNDGERQ